MIQGSAKMEVNEATIICAVQEYLDQRLNEPVKVTAVDGKSDGYVRTFTISLEDPQMKEPKRPDQPKVVAA